MSRKKGALYYNIFLIVTKLRPDLAKLIYIGLSFASEILKTMGSEPLRPLKILTYNIQTGLSADSYLHYLTRSWQYLLPTPSRCLNLDKISSVIHDYDIVGLQEAETGSFRSLFVNQVEYLAKKAGFPHWYAQRTRNFGLFASPGNGLLSKFPIQEICAHRLPGLIPGRGLICSSFGVGREKLLLITLHLSIGPAALQQQFLYIEKLIAKCPHVILMGDMNCLSENKLFKTLLEKSRFYSASCGLKTFPSWSPTRDIDHILVSASLRVKEAFLGKKLCSDHLPLGVSVYLPEEIDLQRPSPPGLG